MPSSPGYRRNYQDEYQNESPERRKARAERHKARRMAEAFYGKKAIEGKDIDHIKPLDQGGKTTKNNIRPLDPHKNRSYPRDSRGQMKRGVR